MGIKTVYECPKLQRIVNAYPKHFQRNKPHLIKKVWKTVMKECAFTDPDIDEIIEAIELRKLTGKTWQVGTGFGQGLQVWLSDHGWEHDYKKVQRYKPSRPEYAQTVEKEVEWTPEQREASRVAMQRAFKNAGIRH